MNYSDQQVQAMIFGDIAPSRDSSDVDTIIDRYAEEYGVDRNLAHAIATQESGKRQPKERNAAGAAGIMQMIPGTEKHVAESLGEQWTENDWTDIDTNIRRGIKHIADLSARFGGDPALVSAAYHAGAGAVERAGGKVPNTYDSIAGISTPQYSEQVLGKMGMVPGESTAFKDLTPAEAADIYTQQILLGRTPSPELEKIAQQKFAEDATIPESAEKPIGVEGQEYEIGGKVFGPVISTLKSIPRGAHKLIETYQGAKAENLGEATKNLKKDVAALESYLAKGESKYTAPMVSDWVLRDIEETARNTDRTREQAMKSMLAQMKRNQEEYSKVADDASKWRDIAKRASEDKLVRKKEVEPAETAVGRFAQDVVGAVTQIATAIGTGPLAPATLASQIAGGSVESVLEKGGSYENAFKASTYNTIAQMPLEMIGFGKLTAPLKKSVAGGMVEKALTEGFTEFLQQYPDEISTILATKKGSNKEKVQAVVDDLWEITKNGLKAGAVGAVTGAGIGGVQSVFGAGETTKTPEVEGKPTQVLEKPSVIAAEEEDVLPDLTPESMAAARQALTDPIEGQEATIERTPITPPEAGEAPVAEAEAAQQVEIATPGEPTVLTETPGSDVEVEEVVRPKRPTFEEFSKLPKEEQQRMYEANPVTDRPGQGAFDRTLSERTQEGKQEIPVAIGDINGFKEYNDRLLGMMMTDKQNQTMFDTMEPVVGQGNVFNLHGDEYAVFGQPRETVGQLRDRVQQAMQSLADNAKFVGKDGKEYRPTMSWKIGMASTAEQIGGLDPKGIGKNAIAVDKVGETGYTTVKASNVPDTDIIKRSTTNEDGIRQPQRQPGEGQLTSRVEGEGGRSGVSEVPEGKVGAKEVIQESEKPLKKISYETMKEKVRFAANAAEDVLGKLSPELRQKVKVKITPAFSVGGTDYQLSEKNRAAYYVDEQGNAQIALSPELNNRQIVEALNHEALGHYGALSVIRGDKKVAGRLDKLYAAAKTGADVQRLRELYKDPKTGKVDEDTLKKEWIAQQMDRYLQSPKGTAEKVWNAIRDFLVRAGIAEDRADALMRDLLKGMSRDKKAGIAGGPLFQKAEGSVDVMFSKGPGEVAAAVQAETKRDIFMRKVVDKFHRLYKIQKSVDPNVSEELDTYLQQELMQGKVERTLKAIEDRFVDPIKEKLIATGIKIEDLEDYLYALHAPERNAYIASINPEMAEGGSGMTDVEAERIVSKVESGPKAKQYKELAAKIHDLNRRTRRVLLDGGLVDAQMIQAWEKYDNYVPLRGINEPETPPTRGRPGKGFDIRGKESKRALGRRSKAHNILAHSIMQAQEAVIRAEKNKVGQTFLGFVEAHPDASLWEVNKVEYERVLDPRSGEVVTRVDPRYKLADNVLSVKRNGVESYITINDAPLASAMKNLGAESSNWAVKIASAANRYLSAINTSLVPEFVLSNLARDLQTMAINVSGEQSAKLAWKIGKGVPGAIKGIYAVERGHKQNEWSKWYKEFEAAGGKVGFYSMENADIIQRRLEKDMRDMQDGKINTLKKLGRDIFKFVSDGNEAVENSTRLSTYRALREAGVSKAKAASAAKNITVNFNKKGELGTFFNSFYLFANANVQGTARLFKALKHKKTQKIVSGIAVGSLALAQLNRMWAGEDDDGENYYDKVPDWVKQNNLVVMFPNTKGKYFKFPIPYGYNVFYALGQSVDKSIHQKDPLGSAAMVAGSIANAFNPLGSAPSVIQTITPTLARPLLDLKINQNFYGAPIIKEQKYGPIKAKSAVAMKGTNVLLRKFTEGLNKAAGGDTFHSSLLDFSPDMIQYIGEYVVGGFGRSVGQMINLAASWGTGKSVPVKEVPFARRFAGSVPDYGDTQKFYENKDEIDRTWAMYEATRTKDKAEYRKKNAAKLRLRERAKDTAKRLKHLRGRRDSLEEKGKTDLVKKIDERIETVIDQFNKRYNEEVK